ncbi:beta strand repeat-containing protein [Psychromonas sp. KJ10-10]|uniref:beta strand repeat-containing protein n=1 Tax=Psychromonas sp. KJ10-10 TaxID=3391823 RepID=UPI0039B49421
MTFTVTLSNVSDTDVTFEYASADNGSALAGTDYTAVNGNGSIVTGALTTTITVPITDDYLAEGSETFVMNLSNVSSNALIADAQGVGTITDEAIPTDDDTATVSITGSTSVIEGEADATYTISVDKAPTVDMTVDVVYSYTSAETGDIVEGLTSVTIPANSLTSAPFNVATVDDAYAEGAEDFIVTISNPSAGGFENVEVSSTTGSITTTILDGNANEPTPPSADDIATVSITGSASVIEGEADASYTISVDKAPTEAMTVDVVYSYTSAETGDIVEGVTSVTIPANSLTSAPFNVATVDDAYAEGAEDFIVSIANASLGGFENVEVSSTAGAVTTTILDGNANEPTPPSADDIATVSITGSTSVIEGEADASYTISVDKAPTVDMTVDVVYSYTSAETGDIVEGVTSVTIPANSLTSAPFNVATVDDAYAEGAEDFIVTISNPSAGGFENVEISSTAGAVTTTILDGNANEPTPPSADDIATVSITGSTSVIEGEADASYTISVDKAPTEAMTVDVVYSYTSAETGDIVEGVTSVTIPANSLTSAPFNVATVDDAYAEGAEDFIVSIANPSLGGFENVEVSSTAGSVTTTINDEASPTSEDTATVSLSGDNSVTEGGTATYTVSVDKIPTEDINVVINTGHTTTDDGDLIPTSINVIIAAGTQSADFNVTNTDDNFAEGTEIYTVTLSSHTDGGFEKTITGTNLISTVITDEDVPTDPDVDTAIISLVGPGAVIEGEVTTDYTVSITEAPASDLTVTFNYTTNDADGNDYTAVGSVVILAGETSATFDIATIDDNLAEGSEDFTVSIATVTAGGLEDVRVSSTENAVTTTITDEVVPTDPDADTAIVSIAGPGTVVEGETTTDYTVTITEAPLSDLTVNFNYTTTDADGNDYTAVSSVVILAGETTATFNIDTIDDNFAEGGEDFTVSIATVENGGLEDVRISTADNAVTTSITDEVVPTDPDADTAIVSIAGPGTVVEGETTTDYTVTITEAPETDLTVTFNYTTTDADGNDYTAVSSVVILAGETTATFNIDTIDDNFAEGGEDFTVSISTVENGGLEDVRISTADNAVTTSITDEVVPTDPDADTAIVSIAGPGTVVEGETTTDYTVTITEAPETDLTVTFNYTTTDADGNDYTAVSSVVILAGETTATFNIDTIDDNFAEGDEDFTVSIATVENGGLEDVRISTADNAVTTSITDEVVPTDPDADTAIVSIAGPGTVVEGETTTDYTVTITEAPVSDLTVNFNYTTTDADGNDYTAVSSVVILAGETTATFNIDTIDDNFAEGGEDFTVSIATVENGGLEDVRISTADNAVTTSITDEVVPTDPDADTAIVSIAGPGTVVEGETTTDYTVTITEAPLSDLTVNFNYTTTDADGNDYTAVSSVVILAGETTATFNIDTIDDNFAEGDEDFTVSIATVENGGLEDVRISTADNAVTTSITDEVVPTDPDADTAIVSIAGPGTVVEGETTTDYTVTITEAPLSDLTVNFNYTTTDADGNDYTAVSSVVILAGETTATFNIETIDDNFAEGSEDFTVSISTVENGGLEDVRISTADNAVTTSITDEVVPTDPDADTAIVSIAGPGTVVEGETTTDYTVTITEAPETDLTVTFNYTTTDADGNDYTAVSSVVILAGETTATFNIDTIDDNFAEGG